MADVESNASVSRQGIRRTNSLSARAKFSDISTRLQQHIKREKETASTDFLSYEKIRWPHYKDVIFRRKN